MTTVASTTAARPGKRGAARIGAPQLVLFALVVAALVLRWTLRDIQTGDFRAFLDPWYTHLRQHGLTGLADLDSNYNTPYLVLLGLVAQLPVPELIAIKTISVVFDLLLGFFAYKIVSALRPATRWLPTLAFGAVIFLPTVVMNGSAWGQCDAVYASLCLGSLYFLISGKAWRACLLFGLALAFKLQAVFFAPVLLGVLVLNRLSRRSLLAVPAVFLAALLPAAAAGRGLLSQLMTYPSQITDGSGGGTTGGRFRGGPGGSAGGTPGGGFGGHTRAIGGGGGAGSGHAFTDNAPTWYAWLPADAGGVWLYVGLGLAAVVLAVFAVWLFRRGRGLEPTEVVLLAATCTLVVPWLLPQMHERYFYPAEVLSVLAIVVGGRAWIAPAVGIQLASVSTYLAYLTGATVLPLGLAAVLAGAAAITALTALMRRLRESGDGRPGPLEDQPRSRRRPGSVPAWSRRSTTTSSSPEPESPVR